jgi:hypothetical protein
MKLNENEIKNVVYSSVKTLLKEGFLGRTMAEGKPEKASDVIRNNGWSVKVLSRNANEMVLRCFEHNDSWLGTNDSLPFNELVEDLNIYFEDKGSPLRAEGNEDENGSIITIRKTA